MRLSLGFSEDADKIKCSNSNMKSYKISSVPSTTEPKWPTLDTGYTILHDPGHTMT